MVGKKGRFCLSLLARGTHTLFAPSESSGSPILPELVQKSSQSRCQAAGSKGISLCLALETKKQKVSCPRSSTAQRKGSCCGGRGGGAVNITSRFLCLAVPPSNALSVQNPEEMKKAKHLHFENLIRTDFTC